MSAPISNTQGMDPNSLEQFGPYPIVRFIAEGGMAWVFETRDPRFESRRLALKVLKPSAGVGEQFKRFVAEARLLAGIDHPNLITIYDLARDQATGLAYYTMNLVSGETLGETGQLGWREAIHAFRSVLDGLGVLHERGVVHRDIKPANILISHDGRVILADLGIARDPDSEGLTRVGTVMGTPAYMPPEQAAGQVVDHTCDLFSLGLSLYRVLCGRSVYEDNPDVDTRSAQSILIHLARMNAMGGEIDFRFPPDVPEALCEVIRRACRRDPRERFQSAAEFKTALEDVLHANPAPTAEMPASESPTVQSAMPLRVLDPKNVEKIGRYDVVRFVAEGGMGWVFEVRDPEKPGERIALKALKPGLGSESELDRFRAEAEILKDIDNRNLMPIYEIDVDPATGTRFYTMPFIDSPPLSERGQLPADDALRIFDGVLSALVALHQKGIVHRDIKPANVLQQERGRAILTDLGIARDTNVKTRTQTGMFLGTALYASPEQARGVKVGPASDVFSVGLSLYHVVTGASVYAHVAEVDPTSETSIVFYLAKLEHARGELHFEFGSETPAAVQALIRKACAFDPEQRFKDAVEMRTALRAVRTNPDRKGAVKAVVDRNARPRRTERERRPRPWGRILALAAGIACAAGFVMADGPRIVRGLLTDPPGAQALVPPTDEGEGVVAADAVSDPANPAPTRVDRLPRERSLTIYKNEPVDFRVVAKPAEAGTLLFYTWTLDGRKLASGTPDFSYVGGRSGELVVRVDDGRGAGYEERWTLEVENRPPQIAAIPAARRFTLTVGDSQTLGVRAADPDGDEIIVETLVDGVVVGEGRRYVFRAEVPGTYRVETVARDLEGAEARVERTIRVQAEGGESPSLIGALLGGGDDEPPAPAAPAPEFGSGGGAPAPMGTMQPPPGGRPPPMGGARPRGGSRPGGRR